MDTNKRTKENTQKDISNISLYKSPKNVLLAGGKEHEIFFKMDRILRALFLLTDHMSDTEVLKRTLRGETADLFKTFTSSSGLLDMDRGLKRKLSLRFASILTLLEVSKTSGLISGSNADILISEIENTAQEILFSVGSKEKENGPELSADFFSMSADTLTDISDEVIKDIRSSVKKEGEVSNGHLDVKDKTTKEKKTKRRLKKTNRINEILGELEDKGEISIKDISEKFPKVSNKTIQRDMGSLIRKGMVRKKGKKRWTTYVLNRE